MKPWFRNILAVGLVAWASCGFGAEGTPLQGPLVALSANGQRIRLRAGGAWSDPTGLRCRWRVYHNGVQVSLGEYWAKGLLPGREVEQELPSAVADLRRLGGSVSMRVRVMRGREILDAGEVIWPENPLPLSAEVTRPEKKEVEGKVVLRSAQAEVVFDATSGALLTYRTCEQGVWHAWLEPSFASGEGTQLRAVEPVEGGWLLTVAREKALVARWVVRGDGSLVGESFGRAGETLWYAPKAIEQVQYLGKITLPAGAYRSSLQVLGLGESAPALGEVVQLGAVRACALAMQGVALTMAFEAGGCDLTLAREAAGLRVSVGGEKGEASARCSFVMRPGKHLAAVRLDSVAVLQSQNEPSTTTCGERGGGVVEEKRRLENE